MVGVGVLQGGDDHMHGRAAFRNEEGIVVSSSHLMPSKKSYLLPSTRQTGCSLCHSFLDVGHQCDLKSSLLFQQSYQAC